jgi:cytochrome d ubiquinol oxidase subunit II
VFWDVAFSVPSLFLAVVYGAALGNVVRGVPLDATGSFFVPLWTNFLPGANAGILDWYTILIGVAALAALTLHGSLWVALKTDGAVFERASRLAGRVWWLVGALTCVITIASFSVQPHLAWSFHTRPWGFIFPILAIAAFLAIAWFRRQRAEAKAFLASCTYLAGMLSSVAFSLYPYVLPASTNPVYGLTVESARAPQYGLRIGLIWWVIGMALATSYTVFTYRRFAGKVSSPDDNEGY